MFPPGLVAGQPDIRCAWVKPRRRRISASRQPRASASICFELLTAYPRALLIPDL
jgi:hypothetical protein